MEITNRELKGTDQSYRLLMNGHFIGQKIVRNMWAYMKSLDFSIYEKLLKKVVQDHFVASI